MLRKKVNLVSIQFQDLQERTDKIKVEAYKEFAEKLKNAAMPYLRGGKYYEIITTRCIDNLLKGMVGKKE